MWEGGVRGIGFVHGAGIVDGGRSYDGLMHVSDVLPTLLAAAGSPLNSTQLQHLDGVDQWAAIASGAPTSGASLRSEVLIQSDPLAIVYKGEQGDSAKAALRVGPWKIIVGSAGCPDNWLQPYTVDSGSAVTTSVHNCTRAPAGYVQLYNVQTDAEERHEVANVNPTVVQRLLERLGELNASFPAPNYPDNDPEADPKLHGGAWAPWR